MKFIVIALGFFAIVSTSVVTADTTAENADLARVSHILNATYPLISAAQDAAPKNTRVSFQYDQLRQDIQAIQAGIAQKINHAPIEPRVVAPLDTHYVQEHS